MNYKALRGEHTNLILCHCDLSQYMAKNQDSPVLEQPEVP